jgi:hypothetical protein
MFHATVRTDRDTLHLIGELDPYSVETLQQQVRGARRDGENIRLLIEIESRDETTFASYARRWLRRLESCGVEVEVEIGGIPAMAWPPSMPRTNSRTTST